MWRRDVFFSSSCVHVMILKQNSEQWSATFRGWESKLDLGSWLFQMRHLIQALIALPKAFSSTSWLCCFLLFDQKIFTTPLLWHLDIQNNVVESTVLRDLSLSLHSLLVSGLDFYLPCILDGVRANRTNFRPQVLSKLYWNLTQRGLNTANGGHLKAPEWMTLVKKDSWI